LLSRREYAKHRGVAVSTVQQAINDGRITTVNGKIDPVQADKQWAENTHPAYQNTNEKSNHSTYQTIRIRKGTYEAALKKIGIRRAVREIDTNRYSGKGHV